jgi:hypothetical protein
MDVLALFKEHYEWIFSGVGVFILAGVYKVFGGDKTPVQTNNIDSTLGNSIHITNSINNNIAETSNDKESVGLASLKDKTRILFIDDDTKFGVVKLLKNAGWLHTKLIKDCASVDDQVIVESNILFLDIQGIGLKLGFKDEGLGLAVALKKKYPEKKLVIY